MKLLDCCHEIVKHSTILVILNRIAHHTLVRDRRRSLPIALVLTILKVIHQKLESCRLLQPTQQRIVRCLWFVLGKDFPAARIKKTNRKVDKILGVSNNVSCVKVRSRSSFTVPLQVHVNNTAPKVCTDRQHTEKHRYQDTRHKNYSRQQSIPPARVTLGSNESACSRMFSASTKFQKRSASRVHIRKHNIRQTYPQPTLRNRSGRVRCLNYLRIGRLGRTCTPVAVATAGQCPTLVSRAKKKKRNKPQPFRSTTIELIEITTMPIR